MKKYILFYFIILSLFFSSCVEEYKISKEIVENYESQLVVEGRILAGDNSIIYLSNTVPFGTIERPEAVLNANITIIGQNGYESSKAEFDIENDRYFIPTHDLPVNTLYALKVEVDGEIYQSEFQPIQASNEIDDVYYKQDENDVTIYISAHGEKDDSSYYMWSYEEDWEVHPSVDVSKALDKGYWMYSKEIYPEPITKDKNPYYNCWIRKSSNLIYLYDTSKLQQNSVIGHQILSIPLNDSRMSYLYSILIKQIGLNENNYEYFRTQKLYTEESSGLFAPMPTELKGNVSCISTPKRKVHGYVIASEVTKKRIFIYAKDLNQKELYDICTTSPGLEYISYEHYEQWTRAWKEERKNGAFIWNAENGKMAESSILYSRTCVDCRAFPGATKKRPDFWPTDHE